MKAVNAQDTGKILTERHSFKYKHLARQLCDQMSHVQNVKFMASLHCRIRIQVLTLIWIPNLMATLYYAEHVCFVWSWIVISIRTQIPNRYCTHFGMDIHTWIGIRVRLWQCKYTKFCPMNPDLLRLYETLQITLT